MLVLIPNSEILNLLVTTTIFVLVAHEVRRITEELVPILIPSKPEALLRNCICLGVIFLFLYSSEQFNFL